jgi:uncharacterized protein (TIGR03435 family)
MRLLFLAGLLALPGVSALALQQPPQPAFEVVSVRPSTHEVGPDDNNQLVYSETGFTARNATLKRLIAEAWRCQVDQVDGPPWLNRNEYDISARLPEGTDRPQIALMLQGLLFSRFRLREHADTRPMRVFELTVGPDGPKIHPALPGSTSAPGPGFHFRGSMRQLADLLAVQFSIPAPEDPNVPVMAGGPRSPVLDKTGLAGDYEFTVDLRPEPGTDTFTQWKRALKEDLGLNIESRRNGVEVVVVDDAAKIPTPN